MTQATQYEIGQWVRSLPVGTARAFVGKIIERADNDYVVRDDWNRRFARKADELENLQ